MLSFSPASAFAEVGQTVDSNDTTVIHENVEALNRIATLPSTPGWQTSFVGRCFNILAAENKAAKLKQTRSPIRAADRGNQQFNEDGFSYFRVNFNGFLMDRKES